jgi:hypothetical protein
VPEVEGNFGGEPIDSIHVWIMLRQVLPHTNLKTKGNLKKQELNNFLPFHPV